MYETTYHRPSSVDEAASLFAKGKEAKYLAGGHTLLPVMKQRLASPSDVIDLGKITADEFFKGLFSTALQDGEIIIAVSFPVIDKAGYGKFPHPASRFALTGVFVAKTPGGEVRAAATGASQNGVMRVPAIEAALKANWSAGALDGVKISSDGLLNDIHGSSSYRANLIKVMAQRAVTAAG